MKTAGHYHLTPDGAGYPAALARVPDRPDHLYVRGRLVSGSPAVAIVGSRSAVRERLALARDLAADIASSGGLVISGGAVGIDAAAHRGALSVGGATISVLAGGLDRLYPARNHRLFADIVAHRGALCTPYPKGSPPRKFHFVRRNRIMAGMADAVVVVEASLISGALHTALAAREYRRVLAAVPGSPGCERLIAEGAQPVESMADLMIALEGRAVASNVELPEFGTDAAAVLSVLARRPSHRNQIAQRSGLPMRRAVRALLGLELDGLATSHAGNSYARSRSAAEVG